ncbi:MAG: hypothetical protein R6U68_13225, partial [Desulfobacteraceae bacterium]
RFFHWALAHGKHAMAVLKDERRDLLQDAQQLFESMAPTTVREETVLQLKTDCVYACKIRWLTIFRRLSII